MLPVFLCSFLFSDISPLGSPLCFVRWLRFQSHYTWDFLRERKSVSCSVMSDSANPWTVVYQAPLSMEFSRQEYWSGLPFPSSGIKPRSPAWQADSLLSEPPGKGLLKYTLLTLLILFLYLANKKHFLSSLVKLKDLLRWLSIFFHCFSLFIDLIQSDLNLIISGSYFYFLTLVTFILIWVIPLLSTTSILSLVQP